MLRIAGAHALRCPHLMLTDVRCHDRILGQRGKQRIEEVGRGEMVVARVVARQLFLRCARGASPLFKEGKVTRARR